MNILLDFSFFILLFVSAIFDVIYRRIPNQIIVIGIALWLLAGVAGLFLHENSLSSLRNFAAACFISAPVFIVSFVYRKISGRKAFGGGDIKLLFMTGLIFIPEQAPVVLVVSLATAALYAALMNVSVVFRNMKSVPETSSVQKKRLIKLRYHAVPFAPAVFIAAVVIKGGSFLLNGA